MNARDLARVLDLQEARHYRLKNLKVPVIDSHLYTALGKQLFDLYQKYKIEKADQRQIESLAFLLSSFVVNKDPESKSVLKKLKGILRREK